MKINTQKKIYIILYDEQIYYPVYNMSNNILHVLKIANGNLSSELNTIY